MILETAQDAIDSIDEINALHKQNMAKLEKIPLRNRENAIILFEYIEKSPIIDTTKTASDLGLSYNTTAKNIAVLCEKEILIPASKKGKATRFSYEAYLNILRKGTE